MIEEAHASGIRPNINIEILNVPDSIICNKPPKSQKQGGCLEEF